MSEGIVLGRCPICSRPADFAARPFCSRRCADIDLGRWFGGRYLVSRPDFNAEADDLAEEQEPGRGNGGI